MGPRLAGWRPALAIGLVGWLAVVLTLWQPGITADEPFNVLYGKYFVSQFLRRGWDFFSEESITDTFSPRSEHPPLGRWVIGWSHWLLDSRRLDPSEVDLRGARLAPATVFALLSVLLVRFTSRHYGEIAGIVAGLSLLLMPRLYAHAHFAVLETIVNWTYFAGVASAAWMMSGPRPWLRAPWGGVLLGCALLTKVQGVLLVPLVGLWAALFYRWRGLSAGLIWGTTAAVVFFIGWPWLWSDVAAICSAVQSTGLSEINLPQTMPHLTAFVGSNLDRDSIFVSYFGQIYRDSELPWHYPWVLFALTVPVGLHALGLCGLGCQLRRLLSDPRGMLLLGAILFPLCLFSIPRVPVYDGARLFLMVFPVWAVFVGRGAGWVWEQLARRSTPRRATALLGMLLLTQAFGVCYYHPFQLSYYNLLVGGLRGAAHRGLEVTYWGDTVTPKLVDRWSKMAQKGARAVLVPSLYEEQPKLYETPATRGKEQSLERSLEKPSYLIVYNRRAYLTGSVAQLLAELSREFQIRRDGVWLSAIYRRPVADDR